MTFLNLSLELRDQINSELLCPPQGIHLDDDYERCARQREKAKLNGTYEHMVGLESTGFEVAGDAFDTLSSVLPLPISILRTNKQLHKEASRLLYGRNRFTVNTNAGTTVRFFKNLPKSSQQLIRDVGFGSHTAYAYDHFHQDQWHPLCDFIRHHMQLRSVTIQIPVDTSHEIDEQKEMLNTADYEWFWWPAVSALTKLLMEGSIKSLRLGYSATLLHKGSIHPDIAFEEYSAISILRYPHPDEERERESAERIEYRADEDNGSTLRFACIWDLVHDQKRRRQKLDFIVKREDDPVGDVGTVLVLTRPSGP